MLTASKNTKDLPEFRGASPKIAVIAARYHGSVADSLTKGAVAVLTKADIPHEIFNVSGVLDLPTALKLVVSSTRFEGYVVLGSIISASDDGTANVIYGETLRGIGTISGQGYPLGSAIICADSKKNLTKMASTRKDDCGGAAAKAALELVAMARDLSGVTKNIGFKPASEFIQMAGEAPKTT
jgi:6,7-dimethyl-8-ribityllumazine synthase